ncbi:MAG TPA: Ig-like domain-containing protein, partial [Acidimicrobiia bacterium]|nr:Ig-like domain-containing protein [Acidimicrobiia bacterium]
MTSQVAHRHPSLAIRRTTIVIVLLSMVTSLFGPWTDIPAEAAGDPSDRAELTSVVRTNPAANVPFVAGNRISDYVSGVVELGDTVIVAGRFPSVRNPGSGTSIPRANIFAYSKSTGLVSNSFVPAVNGTIDAMAAGPDGQSVIIGGSFSTVNGEPSFGLARLNISNGQRVAGWNTTTQGRVRDLIVRGNNLYLGGDFWNVGGQPRERLAKVNATTGAVDPSFNVAVGAPRAGTHDWVTSLDISADGSTMVIVGNFIDVGGQPRVQVALIDIPGNSVLPWSTQGYASACSSSFWTYMRDIEFSPDDDYFVAVTTGGPFLGTLCDTAARWEHEPATSGANASWVNWSGGDTLTAVAVTTGAVYIGGHQRWMNNHSGRDSAQQGAVSREGLAALDPLNGAPYEWNPGRDRGSVVHTLFVTPTGLYLGGDTDTVNFQQKGKLAFFPLQGGTSVPAPTPVSLPVDIRTAQANGDLTMRSYDGDTATPATVVPGTGIDWSTVRGATLEAGNLYYTLSDSRLYRRSFDGTTFGPAEDLISGVYAGTAPSLVDVTSMTWSDGRLYFTRSGQSALFYRYVSLESGIIGSQTFSIPSQPTGFQPVGTSGMEVIGDHLYYTRIDGNLRRIQMANGAPVPGTVELLSGPLVDGQTWTGTDFFVSGEIDAPPTVDITAPADGATVEGSVAITATADDDNGVDSVEFRVDGVSVGTDTNGNDGWSVDWDTTTTTNANHTISAVATDTGNQTGTDAVDVLVANVGEPTVLFSGTVDSTSATGPRWTSTIYTPTVSGPDQLTLDWDGPANLRFDIRVAGTNAWVGANTTTDQPKTITANLTAGTQYRIAVWSMSGAAEFTVTSGASVPDDEL